MKVLKKTDKPLLLITSFMFLFGLLMIFSASYVKAITALDNAYYYLIRQGIILIICLFLFLVLINIPTTLYKNTYKTIIYGSIGILLLLYPFGIIVNGAKSWISLPFFNFQPAELVKIGIILYMAYYYEKNRNNKEDYKVALKPYIYITIIMALVIIQPDLGTALIIGLLSLSIFFVVPMYPKVKRKTRSVMLLTGIIGALVIGLMALSGRSALYAYQIQRFNFLKPCARYTEVGTGYQVCNSYIAINNGGLFGVGIGNSTQKYLYLPESYTDFIFPVIVEELGIITGAIIMVIYAYIIFRILKIAKKAYSLSHGLICYGVAIYIFIHIFINLVGVLGLLPLTGVPLPFLSYGGSYAMCVTIALSLVQRVNIETKILKQETDLKNRIREI